MASARRILLLSTSTVHGSGYLEYAEAELRDFLAPVRRVVFVPFALQDHGGYAAKARSRFLEFGLDFTSLHEAPDPKAAIVGAEALFVGGGNTFRLLKAFYDLDLLQMVRARVEDGMLYLGSSAGSNLAGPTIRTTNDMPIVEPPSFTSLGLVPFQINPHYVDADPTSTHMGETREERIRQFLEENSTPVLAMREGAMVRVERSGSVVRGMAGARLFRAGAEPIELEPGTALESIVSSAGV